MGPRRRFAHRSGRGIPDPMIITAANATLPND